jgi:hypothetical protein
MKRVAGDSFSALEIIADFVPKSVCSMLACWKWTAVNWRAA